MAEAVAERGVEAASVRVIFDGRLGLECTGDLTYNGLFARYANSEFGQFQAKQPARYSNKPEYAYDRAQMIADLGDDVHPLNHMPYTESQIFRPLMVHQNLHTQTEKLQPFSRYDVVAGRLGALWHDIGECQHDALGETVGDINYHLKTADDEKKEAKIRRYLYETLYADVPVSLVAKAEATIAAEPKSADGVPEEFLARAFQTTEWIGYFLTGVRAGRRAIELRAGELNDHDAQRAACLGRLGVEVSNRWFDRLPERAAEFPYARIIREREALTVERINETLAV